MSITFRPISPDDEALLLEIYTSTRSDELSLVPWDEAQKEAFVKMQFVAQHNHYQQHYPAASYEIILADERPVGRLYVARLDERMLVLDLTMLPGERNQGVGTSILKNLMEETSQSGKPLHIHVETFNPSLRLFERLGFQRIEEDGCYLLMEWNGERAAL